MRRDVSPKIRNHSFLFFSILKSSGQTHPFYVLKVAAAGFSLPTVSEVHGQGSLLGHLKVPSSAPCSANIHIIPPVILLVLLVLLHHPVLPPQSSIAHTMMALHAAWFDTGPALLAQAAVEFSERRKDGLDVPSEGWKLHGSPAQCVCTFAGLDGVDGRLRATVVFMDAARS